MEQCKYEKEIIRLAKVLDGNGQGGVVKDVIELQTKHNTMCEDIQNLKETAEAQATSISGFNKYMSSREVLEDYKSQHRKEKRQLLFFFIAQSLAVIALGVTIVLTLTGQK